MDEDDKDERRGFRVTDRRRFSETGEARDDEPGEEAAAPTPIPAGKGGATPAPEPTATGGFEPVSFSTFVLGLSTQALLHLGEIPNPVSRAVERDLEAARQVIDILGILRAKTRNNLDPDEDTLLESVLYDLRIRYVELLRGSGKEKQ